MGVFAQSEHPSLFCCGNRIKQNESAVNKVFRAREDYTLLCSENTRFDRIFRGEALPGRTGVKYRCNSSLRLATDIQLFRNILAVITASAMDTLYSY